MESISNNRTFTPYVINNCILLSIVDGSPKFSRGMCQSRKRFICQIDKASCLSEENNFQIIFNSSSCPGRYYEIDKICYKFQSEEKTFDEAEMICNNENNSHLASVKSFSENAFLQLLMIKYNATGIWLGLKMKNSLDQGAKPVHYWNDGNPAFYNKWVHEDFGRFSVGQSRCTKQKEDSSGLWDLVPCNKSLPFICKLVQEKLHTSIESKNTFCPASWYAFNGSCYYINEEHDTTWQKAVEECILLDSRATLGHVYTTMEKQAIKYFLDIQNHPGLWTGTFVSKRGKPMNIDGSNVINENLEKLDEREKEENCAKLSIVHGREVLNWDRCDQKYGFVCKMESIQHVDILLSNATSAGCPNQKWARRGDYCYHFLPDQFLTWTQSETMCALFGKDRNHPKSHLVSIQDSRENHFIQVLLQMKTELPFHRWAWIGFNMGFKDGWTDGQEIEYENWSKSNLFRTTFLCTALETTTGIWTSKRCDELLGAVCKIHIRDQLESTAFTTITNPFNNKISSPEQSTTKRPGSSLSVVYTSRGTPAPSINSSDKQIM